MGYDITFHPIGKKDIEYYIFSVIENPKLVDERVSKLTEDVEEQEYILDAYYLNFPEWIEEIKEQSEQDRPFYFGAKIGYATAAIMGYIYPFWYNRGQSISFLAEDNQALESLFIPITELMQETINLSIGLSNKLINQNYMGSGVVVNLGRLEEILDSLDQTHLALIDPVKQAINYCRSNNLFLMEVADVYGVLGCGTKEENCQNGLD